MSSNSPFKIAEVDVLNSICQIRRQLQGSSCNEVIEIIQLQFHRGLTRKLRNRLLSCTLAFFLDNFSFIFFFLSSFLPPSLPTLLLSFIYRCGGRNIIFLYILSLGDLFHTLVYNYHLYVHDSTKVFRTLL